METMIAVGAGALVLIFVGAMIYSIALQRHGTNTQGGAVDMVRESMALQKHSIAMQERSLATLEAILAVLQTRAGNSV
jgi:hypothetical protein